MAGFMTTPAFNSLDELPELRPFPDVANRMLAACDDPDTNPATLCEIMRCDPAVSVRVLRVANSSMYGFPGEICSVDHAIVVLGFKAIRNLALSFSAGDLFNHLGYVVDDVDGLADRMQSAGYREGFIAPAHPYRKRRYFYDADEVEWEFVEYLSDDPAQRNDYSQ